MAQDTGKEEKPAGNGYGSFEMSASREVKIESYHAESKEKYTTGQFRLKVVQSLVLFLGILVIGLGNAIVGPTLLDLQITAHADTTTISYVFIGRSVGGILGTCLAGPLVDRMNRWLFCGLSVLLTGVFFLFAPWMPEIIGLVAVFCVISAALNAFDTASTMTILWVWGDDNGPWMQAFHCFYALGGLVAPVIAKPFLTTTEDEATFPFDTSAWTNVTTAVPDITATQSINGSSNLITEMPAELTTDIWKCYLIMACLAFASALLFLLLLLAPKQHAKLGIIGGEEGTVNRKAVADNRCFFVTMLMFVLWFCFLFCLVQMTSMSYLFTYAVEYLMLSKQTAADVNTAFWVGFMAGRVSGIFIVKFIPVSIIMAVGNVIITISLAVMVLFAHLHPSVVWVTVAVFAFIMGPLFATNITWTQQYIQISGVTGSAFLVAASLGESVGPIILGSLSADYGFVTFGYLLLTDAAVGMVTFFIMLAYAWAFTKTAASKDCEEKEQLIVSTSTKAWLHESSA